MELDNQQRRIEYRLYWLGGIIDGEGSIYIGNFSSNPKTGSLYYQTNIEVTNTDKALIDWILNNFGGRSYAYSAKQTPKNSRKAVYRWLCSGDMVTHLCEIMMPYLVIKKRQAEIMLKMRATYNVIGAQKGKQGISVLDKSVLDLRKSLFDEIRSLHVRNHTAKDQ